MALPSGDAAAALWLLDVPGQPVIGVAIFVMLLGQGTLQRSDFGAVHALRLSLRCSPPRCARWSTPGR